MNTNNISFKGKFEVDMPSKRNANIADVHKYYDSKIQQLQEERMKVLDTIEFMNKPEVQAKIEKLPNGDTVCFAPIEELDKGVERYNPIFFFEAGEETEDKLLNNKKGHILFDAADTILTLEKGTNATSKNVGNWLDKVTNLIKESIK